MPYLSINDHKIEYQWIGPTPGVDPTLVFLHEGLGCIEMWRDFPSQVAEHTQLGGLIYSRIGYGGSEGDLRSRRSDYIHREALDFLPKILKSVEINECYLVGHSDGASIALLYASRPSISIKGMILEAPHVFVEDVTLEGIRKAGELYRTTDLARQLERYHGGRTDAVFAAWHDVWLAPEFREWNIEDCLPNVEIPTLLIQGKDDEYASIHQLHVIANSISASCRTRLLSGCGHTPHKDQEEKVTDIMVKYIKNCELG